MRVSVVITSYNHKDYLIEAVESVMAQTVRPHEILIADDGSSDGSVEVIREYMVQHEGWIKGVFQERNVGIPKNRNAALRQVTGTHVSVLDGDDRYHPNRIEREVEALAQHPQAGVVYSNVRIVDADGTPTGIRDGTVQPSGDVFAEVSYGAFGLMRSMLAEYALVREAGFMDERFPKYDGYDLTVQLAARTPFVYIAEPLTDYRVHPTSDSKTNTAAEHLHDLEGIYNKMLPLIARRTPEEQRHILRPWARGLCRWRLHAAMAAGRKQAAFEQAVMGALRGKLAVKEVLRVLVWLLPESLAGFVKARRAAWRASADA